MRNIKLPRLPRLKTLLILYFLFASLPHLYFLNIVQKIPEIVVGMYRVHLSTRLAMDLTLFYRNVLESVDMFRALHLFTGLYILVIAYMVMKSVPFVKYLLIVNILVFPLRSMILGSVLVPDWDVLAIKMFFDFLLNFAIYLYYIKFQTIMKTRIRVV